jgi:hypothetical protein
MRRIDESLAAAPRESVTVSVRVTSWQQSQAEGDV